MNSTKIYKYGEKYCFEISKEDGGYNVYQLRYNTPLQNETDEVKLERRTLCRRFSTKKQAASWLKITWGVS